MRGERTHATRCYLPELERIQERVAQMDHAGDGKKHGSADAVRWAFGEYDRLVQSEQYLILETARLLSQKNAAEREINRLRRTVSV